MPGWHEATKELQESGAVQMVGIIQEQHPARCRLFMQWKEMDWPIMVDALNLLEVKAVPLTYFIDEHGVIRDMPRRRGDLTEMAEAFVAKSFDAPPEAAHDEQKLDPSRMSLAELYRAKAEALVTKGVYAIRVSKSSVLDMAINSFDKALEHHPKQGLTHFQLGVAYRLRYDSDARQPGDFAKAVEHWQLALDDDPNQYIWRRRIQQYGPRLMKPYPFYDWVPQARKDVAARGETPHKLIVEPSGAEYAQPSRSFSAEATQQENPDPRGGINRDKEGFISVETVVVPAAVKPGKAVRVHVQMRPNVSIKAHWNNEADDTEMWIDPPAGWEIDQRRHKVGIPPDAAVSLETRTIEFELKVPDDAKPGKFTLPAYALYYVCEDINGVCLFRRQDISISVTVVE